MAVRSPGLAGQVRASMGLGLAASLAGLLAAYWLDVPAGPAIVLAAGALWLGSLVGGPHESLAVRWLRRPHLTG